MTEYPNWLRMHMLVYVPRADVIAAFEREGMGVTEGNPLLEPGWVIGQIQGETVYGLDGYIQVTVRVPLPGSPHNEFVVWLLAASLLPAIDNAVEANELHRQGAQAAINVDLYSRDETDLIVKAIQQAMRETETDVKNFERFLVDRIGQWKR